MDTQQQQQQQQLQIFIAKSIDGNIIEIFID
jgi:hypothetical protein